MTIATRFNRRDPIDARRPARNRYAQALSGARRDPRMSGNCELGRGLRTREYNATEAGAGRCEKPAPDARAAPPEAHESPISRKTVEEVPLTGLSFRAALPGLPASLRTEGREKGSVVAHAKFNDPAACPVARGTGQLPESSSHPAGPSRSVALRA